MTVIKDPANEFDFAYKGYQYPIPPSWKYAVRLQDQIQWLLQALLKVNANGLSIEVLNDAVDELNADIAATDAAAQGYAAQALSDSKTFTNAIAAALEEEIKAATGGGYVRDPVTGEPAPAYVALKHIFDFAAAYGLTWGDLASSGKTWQQVAAYGTWQKLAQYGGAWLNIRTPDNPDLMPVTPTDDIPTETPGY